MAAEFTDRPFAELPAGLVDEVLQRTEGLSDRLLADFEQVRAHRQEWRSQLTGSGLLHRDSELPYVPIPTACGIDGSHAVERLLASDLVAAAALAVEGLTPPSETRHWPEPRHLVYVDTEAHDPDTGTILRALMIGMELELAANAPHEVIFLDGSLTTPFIYFNQALNKAQDTQHLQVTGQLKRRIKGYLEAYQSILASTRTDRCWLAVPKYTANREIGRAQGWPETQDDRSLLTFLLEPGEFTQPLPLQKPSTPWHLNVSPIPPDIKDSAERLSQQIVALLGEIRIIYYRMLLSSEYVSLSVQRFCQ